MGMPYQGDKMARKIFSWMLIVLGAIFLLLSVVGIGAAWIYNEPLTREVTNRLNGIDSELVQAQTTLASTQVELERALRIVNAAETSLEKLAQQSTTAESIFDSIQNSLDDRLLPELKTTRERINVARNALENLRSLLLSLSALPFIDVNIPDQILTDLIASTNSLDTEIANAEEIARRASTFVSDTSYLLGGDLSETRDSLKNFLAAVDEYQGKISDWRAQVADLNTSLPLWIDRASIILTVFLFWFGLSQFSLLLHGRIILRGDDPLEVLRTM
jgi:F0F1-type ATP synthase membrane subunit b/b'